MAERKTAPGYIPEEYAAECQRRKCILLQQGGGGRFQCQPSVVFDRGVTDELKARDLKDFQSQFPKDGCSRDFEGFIRQQEEAANKRKGMAGISPGEEDGEI